MSKRLIGSYGQVVVGPLGTEIVAAGTATAGVLYVVTGVDAATALPTGATVGYVFEGSDETLTGTDAIKPLPTTTLCDIQSASIDGTTAQIDVTTLCDEEIAQLAGKTTFTGALEGVMTEGITDEANGLLNNFVDVVKQETGTYTITAKDNSTVIALIYTDKTTTSGEFTSLYVIPVSFTGWSDTISEGESQAFSSPFTKAPSDDVKMQYVKIENA